MSFPQCPPACSTHVFSLEGLEEPQRHRFDSSQDFDLPRRCVCFRTMSIFRRVLGGQILVWVLIASGRDVDTYTSAWLRRETFGGHFPSFLAFWYTLEPGKVVWGLAWKSVANVQCPVGVCPQPTGGEQGPWPSLGKEPLPSICAYTYAWPSIFPSIHPVTPLVSP